MGLKGAGLKLYSMTLNLGPSDDSSCPDGGHAFLVGIPQKWCYTLLGASLEGTLDVNNPSFGHFNFNYLVILASAKFFPFTVIISPA